MKTVGLILMGVSGCGKSTVGKMLADRLGWIFFDGDDFHPPGNKRKMAAGIPLTDDDRAPWLAVLHDLLAENLRAGRHPILACSALRERYRRTLLAGNEGVRIVFLKGEYKLSRGRMAGRTEHYMKPGMLRSQFAALEEPAEALVADISRSPNAIVEFVCSELGLEKQA